MLDKFKQGLTKTARMLNTDIRDLFKTGGRLVDHAFLDELFATLIKTDVGVEAAQQMIEQIREKFGARVVMMEEVLQAIKEQLRKLNT